MAHYENYLRNNLSTYIYPDQAKTEVTNALREFPDLRPGIESFTFPNGETQQLLALNGTIPVNHRGNTYNIPVCLYMQRNLPYDAPMVYVKPTQTMEIKTSNEVDGSGKIYLPYLSSWCYPQSDLTGLIQVLQIQFGDKPPVVSRGQQQQQQPSYGWGAGYGWNSQQTQMPPYPQQQQQQQQSAYPYQQSQYPQYPQQQQQQSGTRQDFNDEAFRQSILSAVEEKVKRRYADKRAQLQAELDGVRRTNQDLNEGKAKLEGIMRSLDEEKQRVQSHIVSLEEKSAVAEDLVSQLKSQESISPDEAVDATAPLYRQIVRCYAEEQALEDTIYALGDALKKGGVDFDAYLKNIRELSRRQFLLRATIQAGRLKAGLPEL